MSNVLSEEKKQQVIALGKLGWPLRRIEQATGVRRETASAYLKSAGVVVCLPGWGRRAPAKPAIRVTPDSEAKPATVTPDLSRLFQKNRAPRVPLLLHRPVSVKRTGSGSSRAWPVGGMARRSGKTWCPTTVLRAA